MDRTPLVLHELLAGGCCCKSWAASVVCALIEVQ